MLVAAFFAVAGCKKPIDSEPKKDDLPALAKLDQTPANPSPEQGDATKTGRLQKPEPQKSDATKSTTTDSPSSDDAASDNDSDDDSPSASDRPHVSSKHPKKGEPSAEPTDEPAASPTHLSIKRIQFSESIDKREPVSPEETFSAKQTDKVYAFVELDNPEKARGRVFVQFIPPVGTASKVELRVGDKSRWRTWALRRNLKTPGTWTVVVKDAKGNELGKRTFEVTE